LLDFVAAAQPQAPVSRAQAAAQVCLDDADDLVDLIIRHFGLAETTNITAIFVISVPPENSGRQRRDGEDSDQQEKHE
jgi:hypothetical protein